MIGALRTRQDRSCICDCHGEFRGRWLRDQAVPLSDIKSNIHGYSSWMVISGQRLQHKQWPTVCWTSMSVFPFFIHLLLFNFDCHSKMSKASFIQSNPRPISLFSSMSEASWALPGLVSSSGFLPQIIYKDIKVPLEFTVLSVRVANCSLGDTVLDNLGESSV